MERKIHRIYIGSTGKSFPCRENEFIIEAMTRAGCGPVHYGCFGGGCGVCKMKIISGEYHVGKKMSRAHLSEKEQNGGTVLICCVSPRGDLTIESV